MNVSHTTSGCTASGGGPPPFYKAEHPPQEHQPDHMYYQVLFQINYTLDIHVCYYIHMYIIFFF